MYQYIKTAIAVVLVAFLLNGIFSVSEVSAQVSVVINEFSSTSNNDWIELYNTSNSQVDLNGWLVKDAVGNDKKYSSLVIPASGYCVTDFSNWLNNNGDTIELYNGSQKIDCVSYGGGSSCGNGASAPAPETGQVAARRPNGTGTWQISSMITSGYSNDETVEPPNKVLCFSPTPVPTPTSIPTASPTSTPTSSPTRTPTSTPKPTSSPKPKSPSPRPSPTAVLGESLGLATPSPIPEGNEPAKKKLPFLAFLMVGGGILMLGGAAYPLIKTRLGKYNDIHGKPQN